jgi:hypothetical protein
MKAATTPRERTELLVFTKRFLKRTRYRATPAAWRRVMKVVARRTTTRLSSALGND